MSCDLNPRPVSSGNGFDYNQIKNSIARNLGIDPPPPTTTRRTSPPDDPQRHLSRSSSVRDTTYSRSTRASSISRTSSFADRSYGTRTNLARKSSFSISEYGSAVRRSSVFDGYAGYSIYSSISEGLDQITYGGRSSRRNSITDMTYSFSRRGSVSGSSGGGGGGIGGSGADYPLPALMAALDASKASQEEKREKHSSTAAANAHVNGQASAYLSSLSSGLYSRQSSNNESPRAIDSPFGVVSNGHVKELQRSDSKIMTRRLSTLKPSQSGHKLERKVSFHSVDQIVGAEADAAAAGKPDKPKRKKERTEEEKAARREKKERKERKRLERGLSKDRKAKEVKQHPSGEDLVDQLSAKLQVIEQEQAGQRPHHAQASSSNNLNNNSNNSNANNPAPTSSSSALSQADHSSSETRDKARLTNNPANPEQPVVMRRRRTPPPEDDEAADQQPPQPANLDSKRNSLDNKSVQSLAKDLAAECAKAYELMENSLTKLTNDFSIGPFGLTPKNKVGA